MWAGAGAGAGIVIVPAAACTRAALLLLGIIICDRAAYPTAAGAGAIPAEGIAEYSFDRPT